MTDQTTPRARTYYAVTSTGGQERFLVVGNDRRQVADAADRLLRRGQPTLDPTDIHQVTELRNLRVVSRTQLRRAGYREDAIFAHSYEAILPESVDDVLASQQAGDDDGE